MNISICIPTYKRPHFLKEAIESCLTQSLLPFEILVGDDSTDNDSENLIKEISKNNNVHFKYFHNNPSLKQAYNINSLFDNVAGDLTLLLHDDDVLMPDALFTLHTIFIENPNVDVAFGKQYIMSNEGVVDFELSEKVNEDYYRTAQFEGMKLSPIESAIVQFPNDCYMIKSKFIKSIRYNNNSGDACDFDFGLQVGISNAKIYFVNKYTAKYRDSTVAISKNRINDAGLRSFEILEKLVVPPESMEFKVSYLKARAPVAIAEAITLKETGKAWELYFSKWHQGRIFTIGGARRFIRLLQAYVHAGLSLIIG